MFGGRSGPRMHAPPPVLPSALGMSRFHIANGFGDSLDEPTFEQMRAFLHELDVTDEEHGAAWLSTNSVSLEWNGDGRLVLDVLDLDEEGVRHLTGVSRERVLELWVTLAAGDLATIEAEPWAPGNGFLQTPEREAKIRDAMVKMDRDFYDSLGPERADIACRRDGCMRGAVAHSVLCRPHHFESIKSRPSPFND